MLRKLFIIIATAIILLLSACASIQPLHEPEVKLNRLDIVSLALDKQNLRVVLDVYNTNKKNIVIKGLEYRLVVGETELASGNHDEVIRLPADSEQSVAINITTYLSNVLPLLGEMLANTDRSLAYHFDIKVKLSKPIPYVFNIIRAGDVAELLNK